jgi:hypothetical protein
MSDPKDIQQAGQAKIQVPTAHAMAQESFALHLAEQKVAHLDRIAELEKQNAELTREREGLMAVVNKLPLTADGVPIVPGMSVYFENRLGEVVEVFWVLRYQLDKPDDDATDTREWAYSTRAAAESALASHAADQGENDGGR